VVGFCPVMTGQNPTTKLILVGLRLM